QVVLAHVRERDVDIVGAGKVAVGPQEPVALGQDVEDPRAARCGLDLLDPIRLFADAALLALTPALLAGRTAAAIAIGSVAILVAAVLWPPVGVAVLWTPVGVASVLAAVGATIGDGPVAAIAPGRLVVGVIRRAGVGLGRRGGLVGRVGRGVGLGGALGTGGLRVAPPVGAGAGRGDRVDQAGFAQLLCTLDAHRLGDLLQLRQQLRAEGVSVHRGVHQVEASPSSAVWRVRQSAVKRSRPRSVNGCFTSFVKTSNGMVAISAPARADSTTCIGCRSEAASTLVS